MDQVPPAEAGNSNGHTAVSVANAVEELASTLSIDTIKQGRIERVSSLVFLISSISVCLILIFTVINLIVSGADEAVISRNNLSSALAVRIAQIGLTIMAVSVTTSLIARFYSIWGMTFGLIIIGALIVPTTDIVRFILLISGSDRAYNEFYNSESPTRLRLTNKAPKNSISSDNSTKYDLIGDIIIYRMEEKLKNEKLLIENLNDEQKQKLYRIITDELISYSARESINNVIARGSMETLRAISLGDGIAWETAFQYGEKVKEQILFLRSEGLVTFPFDRVNLAKPTLFGLIAFLEVAETQDIAKIRSSFEPSRSQTRSLPGILSQRLGASQGISGLPSLDATQAKIFESNLEIVISGDKTSWVQFKVGADAKYLIRAPGGVDISNDPLFAIYDEAGTVVAQDDDSDLDGNWGAAVQVELKKDKIYRFGIRDLDAKATKFNVKISKI